MSAALVNTCLLRPNYDGRRAASAAVGAPNPTAGGPSEGSRWPPCPSAAGSTSATCPRSRTTRRHPLSRCLAMLSEALEVPIAWFFMGEGAGRLKSCWPSSDRGRSHERSLGRIELVDGGASRDVSIVEAVAVAGGRAGRARAHRRRTPRGLSGRWRMSQGEHVVELGPGDYLRWDGSILTTAEVIGPDDGRLADHHPRPQLRGVPAHGTDGAPRSRSSNSHA